MAGKMHQGHRGMYGKTLFFHCEAPRCAGPSIQLVHMCEAARSRPMRHIPSISHQRHQGSPMQNPNNGHGGAHALRHSEIRLGQLCWLP